MRVLALTEGDDHVCGRYRIRAFGPALASSGSTLTIQGIERGVVGRVGQLRRARDSDVVILQRKLLPGWQLKLLRRGASRLVFDFDDAILYRDSNDPRGPQSRKRSSRFRAVVQAADQVIAGNEFLAECAVSGGARPERVQIIPTCIDPDRYPVVGHRPSGHGIDLVWIGSSSTLAGLEAHKDLWQRIGRDVEGVRLRLICDRSANFPPLPVVSVPWAESTEADELGRSDVGVSWIPADLWSRGKCGLKVLQYQAAGLPVVANPVGVHPAMVVPRSTGYLASSHEEWCESIRTLRDDPASRHEMGRAARRQVERDYSIAAWSETFVSAISGRRMRQPAHVRAGHS